MRGRRTGLRGVGKPVRSTARLPRLESLESRALLATFTVTNNLNAGVGSLRDAIVNANQTAGPDIIRFNIAGSGVKTIALTSALPTITDTVTIDGTTQPGYANSTNGAPLIVLDGRNAGTNVSGLVVATNGVTIRALTIANFNQYGIRITGSGTTVQSSFIGTDPTGTVAAPNGFGGILIDTASNSIIGGSGAGEGNLISGNGFVGVEVSGFGSRNNRIQGNRIGTDVTGTSAISNTGPGVFLFASSFGQVGGSQAGEGNLISGNTQDGIFVQGSDSNTIQGNLIGTDLTGTAAIPNGFGPTGIGDGISLLGSNRNVIGGTTAGAGNLISGNRNAGVFIQGGQSNRLQGNLIGTDVTGTLPLGNLNAGVDILGANTTTIGGSLPGAANTIAFNGANNNNGGVFIFAGSGNRISTNSIFENTGLGIDLNGGNGNAGQAAPVLTNVTTAAGRTLIQGTYSGAPSQTITIEFYTSPTGDPSGFGEGKTFLGSTTVVTDGLGQASINVVFTVPTQIGDVLTATATDQNGNTSEFSNALSITQGAVTDLRVGITTDQAIATVNNDLTYTVTVSNDGPNDASNVVVTDVLPTSVNFKSVAVSTGGTIVQQGATTIVSFASIPAGTSATLTIVVTPTTPGTIIDTASAFGGDIDPDQTNNTASLSTVVNIPIELQVDIQAQPTPPFTNATVGADLVYLVSVLNNGPGTATGVILDALLPPDVIVVDAASGQGTVQVIGNTIRAQAGSLAPGLPAVLRIVVQPTVSGTTSITATARANEVEIPGVDPHPNTVTLDTPVDPGADLSITMQASSEPAVAPGPLTYTIQVTNNGPDSATGVVVSDTLPAEFTNVQATSSQGFVFVLGNTVTASLGTISALSTTPVTVTITATPTGRGKVTNTAVVTSTTADLDTQNNVVSLDSKLNPSNVEVQLDTSDSSGQGEIGVPLTYQFTIINHGPVSIAANTATAVVDLPDPTEATYVPAPGGPIVVDNQLVFNLPALPVDTPVVLSYTVLPLVSTTLSTAVTVNANPPQSYDPDLGDNTAAISTVISPADLSVAMVGPFDSVLVGDDAVFEVFVNNGGTSTATSITVQIPVPAEFTFSSATTGPNVTNVGYANGFIIATIPTLAANDEASFTIRLQPNTVGTLDLTATVQGDEVDPDLSNNDFTTSVDVLNLPGVVSFAQTTYQTRDDAGNAVITLVRSGGTLGPLTVQFDATAGPNAVPGVNFTPVSTTVTFADGQKTATVSVPILNDHVITPAKSLVLTISDIGEGSVGTPDTAVLNIGEGNYAVTGPKVANVQLKGTSTITGFVLTFNEPLDPASAEDINNYFVTSLASGNTPAIPVNIVSAVYNDQAQTVTLTFDHALAQKTTYQISLNSQAILGVSGVPLDGSGSGNAGSSYDLLFTRGSRLSYIDRDGDSVSLALSGPGTIDLFRGLNGEAQRVRVVGGSRSTTISGSVRKARTGNGRANLGFLEGVGLFPGGAKSRLTSPPFFATTLSTPVTTPTSTKAPVVRPARATTPLPSRDPMILAYLRRRGY